jgi:hypothetical protein
MNISDSCFLTPRKKGGVIRGLKAAIKRKEVDKDMIPYLARLNKLKGIVSLFCCSGHNDKDHGNLVMWLSGERFESLLLGHSRNLSCDLWNLSLGAIQDVNWDFFDGRCRLSFIWKYGMTDKAMSDFLYAMERW